MSGSLTGFITTPSTCGVLGLLQSNGAFIATIISDVQGIQSSLTSASSTLLNLPNIVEGIVLSDVQSLANNLTALAVGTMADFVTHLTSQFDGIVNNLSLAINQSMAQAGLVSSGCTLPAMGSVGTTGGLSACGNMQSMFGSIMGSGQNLANQIVGTLNNLTSTVTSLVTNAIDVSSALATLTGYVNAIASVASNIGNMITSEVAALAGALSDLITFGAANTLFNLFQNPCSQQVLNAIGSPALLNLLPR